MIPYREYDPSPLHRFLRALALTFPIGTFFGVHVRMYWLGAVLVPLISWQWTTLPKALLYTALLFVIVWSHEMGHIVAGWRHRIRTDLITLSPLGGVAHMNAPARTPREELQITLAGPAVHLLWLAVFWPLHLLLPAWSENAWYAAGIDAVAFLQGANLALLLFNLLPIFPLDGGRALRALLSMRWHANRATMWVTSIGIGGGALLCVLSVLDADLSSAVGFAIGISCVFGSLQERQLARNVLIYRQHVHDPWESDGDAWKRGGDPQERRPGWFARWRTARADQKARARAAAEAALNAEVDTILERVHRVGMSALTDREKAVLKRASRQRRNTG